MKTIRMLIVEDDSALLAQLKSLYRHIFETRGYDSVTIEEAKDAGEALALARGAQKHPYDFVSLDVNLGREDVTGLNVLGAFKRFKSAWMAALLTGVETDKTSAEELRSQLRRRAYDNFPAERLLVVEKPSQKENAVTQGKLLSNKLSDIASVYEIAARQRYIFRPIEIEALVRVPGKRGEKRKFVRTRCLQWQIRFNCGDVRTLADRAGLKTVHKILSMDRSESLTPEMARVIEPKVEKIESPNDAGGDNPVGAFFRSQGIDWEALTEKQQEDMAKAALAFRFRRYVELRDFEESEDLAEHEADELAAIQKELGPLADLAEAAYQRMRPSATEDFAVAASGREVNPVQEALAAGQLHVGGAFYTRTAGRRGEDSTEATGFRKRKERVCEYLRESGFAEFADHIESFVMSTGANWSYNPPDHVEWTTQ